MSPRRRGGWKIVEPRRSLRYYIGFGAAFGFILAVILLVTSRSSNESWFDTIIVSLVVFVAWSTVGALILWYLLSVRQHRRDT